MIHFSKTTCTLALLLIISSQGWAGERIKIWLKTNEVNAAAIGYKVEGIEQGGMGRSYKGSGPSDKEYSFGYREDSVFGRNVHCGSSFLNSDSQITLIKVDDHCIAVVEQL